MKIKWAPQMGYKICCVGQQGVDKDSMTFYFEHSLAFTAGQLRNDELLQSPIV